jgi:AraC-like DNA-binding protein
VHRHGYSSEFDAETNITAATCAVKSSHALAGASGPSNPFTLQVRIQSTMQRQATIALRLELYQEVTSIVEFEYGDELALDDLAHRVASSRRQLQRAFAEVGHTTFRQYLTAVRMDRAAEMLAGSEMTVREVAHGVGYRQPAQFAKAFRRRHGSAPSDYRAQSRLFSVRGGDSVPIATAA